MTTDAQSLEALDSIQRETEGLQDKAVDLRKLCELYGKVKPLLPAVLALVDRIPIYGKRIGAVIRFLAKLADVACPV